MDEGIFLGYSTSSKSYRLFNKCILVVEESTHIIFDEANDLNFKLCAMQIGLRGLHHRHGDQIIRRFKTPSTIKTNLALLFCVLDLIES